MLCVRRVSLIWRFLETVRSADLRKPGSCSMSHSRASDMLGRTFAWADLTVVGYYGDGLWKDQMTSCR